MVAQIKSLLVNIVPLSSLYARVVSFIVSLFFIWRYRAATYLDGITTTTTLPPCVGPAFTGSRIGDR